MYSSFMDTECSDAEIKRFVVERRGFRLEVCTSRHRNRYLHKRALHPIAWRYAHLDIKIICRSIGLFCGDMGLFCGCTSLTFVNEDVVFM